MEKKTNLKTKKKKEEKNKQISFIKENPNDYIYETYNYDQFKFIEGNRDIVQTNYLRILNSIRSGYIKNPIFVIIMEDGKLGIRDGQHRYLALKELSMPIHYMIQENIEGLTAIPRLNLSRNWGDIDFIQSYAKQGVEGYQKILELKEKYPDFKHIRTYLSIVKSNTTVVSKKNVRESNIRSGEFQIKNWDDIIETCEKLMQFKICKTKYKTNPWGKHGFYLSLLKLFKLPCYNHKAFFSKVELYPHDIVSHYAMRDYMVNFSNVYNYKLPLNKKIFFENYL